MQAPGGREVPPVIGQKRGPGRPPKNSLLPNKRVKGDTTLNETLSLSPSRQSTPNDDKRSRNLPVRLQDTRPLPTIPQPQSLDLPDTEYASIASSGVLAKSIEQSRVSWTQNGVFERFWTKPETGKNARPPPPNNPDVKSMKSRGRCRLRIEPHIFEVELYVVERPRPQPPKQYLPPKPQIAQWQVQQPSDTGTSAVSSAEEKKAGADPVIALLAARAGNDPELKALMKEVAAGNAQPEQLKVFQKHIDELNGQLQTQKSKPAPVHQPFTQQSYSPPVPATPAEVVFAFTTPGATSDRFLFPQYCILEALTPQHLLASFVVTKKGSAATNTADIDVNKEYWSPVTIMVEVAYGREGILKDIQRWVKSGNESREHITKIMSELERVPETHLALRLPLKGSTAAESNSTSKVSTPVPSVVEVAAKKKSVKYIPTKKRSSLAKGSSLSNSVVAVEQDKAPVETTKPDEEPAVPKPVDPNARPTRSTRRSTRYSDV